MKWPLNEEVRPPSFLVWKLCYLQLWPVYVLQTRIIRGEMEGHWVSLKVIWICVSLSGAYIILRVVRVVKRGCTSDSINKNESQIPLQTFIFFYNTFRWFLNLQSLLWQTLSCPNDFNIKQTIMTVTKEVQRIIPVHHTWAIKRKAGYLKTSNNLNQAQD